VDPIDFDEVKALRKAFSIVKERQQKNIPDDLDEKIARLKIVRHASVGNEDLLKRAVTNLKKNGIRVFPVATKDDALEVIVREIGAETLVVKSKSNVTKEIGLAAGLGSKGVTVIETDIGDRILQLLKGTPSHPTGPIAHLSAKTISEGLTTVCGKRVGSKPAEIVEIVREEIRGYLDRAAIGITGANAITAEEGAIVTAHNEGNIFSKSYGGRSISSLRLSIRSIRR